MNQHEEIPLNLKKLEQTMRIGTKLILELREKLIDFLRELKQCFTWDEFNMLRIDPYMITYKLTIDPQHKLVRQQRRKFAPERN